jgi:beta-galactosidase
MAAAGTGEPAEMITLLRAIFVSSIFLSWMWGVATAGQPQTMPLWPKGAPGSEGKLAAESVRLSAQGEHIVSNVHAPSISVTLPKSDTATGAAVIVIPGGGHTELWMDHEGYEVAAYLADHGIAAFVVKYRLARAPGSTYTVEGDSLADIKRAIRLVRSRALQWHVDSDRVGVMGFSAGGELAALAATRYDEGGRDAADPVERQSSRPNFQALLYPGIPKEMSLSKQTPPAFLLAGADDSPTISRGLASLYVEFRKAGVPAELHLYDGVGHGFGLRSSNSGPVAAWPRRFLDWLQVRGIMRSPAETARSQSHGSEAPEPAARRAGFNEGWRFFRGDVAGGQAPELNDDQWLDVRLPHDWAIEGPFDPTLNPHTGGLPVAGIGWYRKTFKLPAGAAQRLFAIEFDGAMSNSVVWINGHELGGRPYGYSGFGFDLTPYLHFGNEPNVLAVRLAPEADASRWYPGAGIYRNVWLDTTGPVHVARWGTYVTTPAVSDERATVTVRTELRNETGASAKVAVRSSILDYSGRQVAQSDTQTDLPAGSRTVTARLNLPQPLRWSTDQPNLYSLVTELYVGAQAVDRYVTPFGVRTVVFDRQRGLLLNGQPLKLQGVCLHHDLGALGAAVNRRAIQRQLQILKAAGVNAVRTSHNPPSPELLEETDRLGFLVIDEAFDMWHVAKTPNDYSKHFDAWSERDLRDMVRRDRNHPSVILWSIGNEIPEQKDPRGWMEARRLTGFFHDEDPTRPTTSAFNNWDDAIRNKLAAEVDIPGFNYKPNRYAQIRAQHPGWIIYGSETASCVSSRGTYQLPLVKYEKDPSLEISSYDIISPRWAYCPDVEFAAQDAQPAVLGEFVWTGFDYIGEPTPYFESNEDTSHDWPARSSYFGMVDLAGFPKDRYYLYQSRWSTQPMVHVLPHWNWAGHEGENIPVMVYSNADEVELLLNGASLGRKKTLSEPVELPVGASVSATGKFQSKYRLLWNVPFQPGELTAIARAGGKEVARDSRRTAGAPARISLLADRNVIQADGDDLSFITVRVEDADGNLCPLANNLVHFRVSGSGRIAGVDNGNAATVEPFHADRRKAFNGLALLIVRSSSNEPGSIDVAASAEGLEGAHLEIDSRMAD